MDECQLRALYTKITEDLSSLVYRLFHEDFLQSAGPQDWRERLMKQSVDKYR